MSSAELVGATTHKPVVSAATASCVDIVVPVFNEATGLEDSVRRLHDYLVVHFPFTFRITIADNASTDETWSVAQHLSVSLAGVAAVQPDRELGRLELPGANG